MLDLVHSYRGSLLSLTRNEPYSLFSLISSSRSDIFEMNTKNPSEELQVILDILSRYNFFNLRNFIHFCSLVPVDENPKWRKLVWSSDGILVAFSSSNGELRCYNTLANLICSIPKVRSLSSTKW